MADQGVDSVLIRQMFWEGAQASDQTLMRVAGESIVRAGVTPSAFKKWMTFQGWWC